MTRRMRGPGAFASLKWKPQRMPGEAFTANALLARSALRGTDWADLLNLTGIVDFEAMGIIRPKDKAIALLHAAAEVEHQFIVQYLYAHYCGARRLPNVAQRSYLMTIAQEEMGHLLTVQNLLAILGESPYIERLKETPDDEEPSPFHLEPLRIAFIARFLIAESGPNVAPPPNIDDFLKDDALAVEQIHRVGAIYAMLYWLFQNSDTANGDWLLSAAIELPDTLSLGHLTDDDLADIEEVKSRLSTAADWAPSVSSPASPPGDKNIFVMPAKDFTDKTSMRQAALSAIHTIAGQGEGPTDPVDGSSEKSHAMRLREIYDSLSALPTQPISPFPIDPYLENRPDASEQNNQITFPAAVVQAQEADKQYEVLLLQIALSTLPTNTNRQLSSVSAINAMFALHGAATALAALPRQAGGDPILKSGPPFTFPLAGIPTDEAAIMARLIELGAGM